LARGLDLEILGELAPGAFHYGMTCLVEFEPHSLWREASLTIAAGALERGVKVEYHVFQQTPKEVRDQLGELGQDVERLEKAGRFRVMDSYTPTTPVRRPVEGRAEPLLSGRSPRVDDWNRAIKERIRTGFAESEKEWLHIDDNEAILLQYNDEEYITNGWRTTFLPMAQARQLLTLHALLTGVASDSFYRKKESLVDAIIDFRASEEGGKIEHYIRLRRLRGRQADSRWRRIELLGDNRAALSSGRRVFGFQNADAERIFDYLVRSFAEEHFTKRLSADASGWRTLVGVAESTGLPRTSLYSPGSSGSLRELLKKGLVERRVFPNQRGRGGKVTRVRVAYQKRPVQEYVEEFVRR
jgi:KaiC/GvpD/RAD55 family RecA-like ATPase